MMCMRDDDLWSMSTLQHDADCECKRRKRRRTGRKTSAIAERRVKAAG